MRRNFSRSRLISRRHIIGSCGGASMAALANLRTASPQSSTPSPLATPVDSTTVLFYDDFADGFLVDGAEARWAYFALPDGAGGFAFVGDDGVPSTSEQGLNVISAGSNQQTGEPAFTKTVPQEGGDPSAVPGGIDHVKWLVYTTAVATSGMPGYDAVVGSELVFRTVVSGQTFGTGGHPFDGAVTDPDDDLRLAGLTFNSYDPETWMVFDFWLTNKRIYAFYERLPFGRAQMGNYAAFSFQIPVGDRNPDDSHELAIAYDRAAGVVRWLVDGVEAFRVERIGYHIDRQYMTIDHGGEEGLMEPRQLAGGMGLLNLLDGSLPSGDALVRLSENEGTYFDPLEGEPSPQVFVDEVSAEGSRLFGQGAELRMNYFTVESHKIQD